MNRRTLLATAAGLAGSLLLPIRTSDAQAVRETDPDAVYDRLLRAYLVESPDGITRVDYARWHANRADRTALDGYIAALEGQRPSQMPRPQAFAYWANLYNAVTLKVILDRYPVNSIRDIRSEGVWLDPAAWTGPWRAQRVTVEGRRLSLDDIEHVIMRPTFQDPRVHYSVNCASIGCPNLMTRAWRAETLEADLDAAAQAFVNHPRGVQLGADGRLTVSSIYRWFIADFGGNDAGVIAHLRRYAAPPLAERLGAVTRIAEDAYDWNLNRVTAGRGS